VEIRLADGSLFEIRPIRPDDKARLAAGHSQLSAETIHRRFLSAKPRLSSTELRYLTELDGRDHVALVAIPAGHPDWIVGVGRFVRLADDPETAEFAIVVGDRYQRRGLGTALARELVADASLLGIRRFTATILSENVAVRRLIERIGEHLTYIPAGPGSREVVANIAA
jgi:RimJ/RimL family protein N-acetyltransferase